MTAVASDLHVTVLFTSNFGFAPDWPIGQENALLVLVCKCFKPLTVSANSKPEQAQQTALTVGTYFAVRQGADLF